jgi:hypothetical protein
MHMFTPSPTCLILAHPFITTMAYVTNFHLLATYVELGGKVDLIKLIWMVNDWCYHVTSGQSFGSYYEYKTL